MLVYRIEDRDDPELGPFNSSNNPFEVMFGRGNMPNPSSAAKVAALLDGVIDPYSLPTPTNDGIDEDDLDFSYHAGFVSLDQYHEWFASVNTRRALFLDGHMVIHKYEVNERSVLLGKHQVMFKLHRAKQVGELTLEEATQ